MSKKKSASKKITDKQIKYLGEHSILKTEDIVILTKFQADRLIEEIKEEERLTEEEGGNDR